MRDFSIALLRISKVSSRKYDHAPHRGDHLGLWIVTPHKQTNPTMSYHTNSFNCVVTVNNHFLIRIFLHKENCDTLIKTASCNKIAGVFIAKLIKKKYTFIQKFCTDVALKLIVNQRKTHCKRQLFSH